MIFFFSMLISRHVTLILFYSYSAVHPKLFCFGVLAVDKLAQVTRSLSKEYGRAVQTCARLFMAGGALCFVLLSVLGE